MTKNYKESYQRFLKTRAWKETCEHFGIKYEEDFWDIKIIDKKEARLKQNED